MPLVQRLPAPGFGTEQVGGIGSDSVGGSVADCPIDDPIPGSASIRPGGPLADGVDDPSGWFVRHGCESIMPGVGLAVQVDVLDEDFVVIASGRLERNLYF